VPPQAPPVPQAAPQPPAAESTQALPLSIFQEEPHQQSYDQPFGQQGQNGHQGQPFDAYGQQHQQQPYGQGYDQYGQPPYEQEQQPGPQHDSDYDHLFRSDVPGPEPLRQRIIQPPSQQQAPAYGQQPPQGYDPGYGYDDGGDDRGGRRRMSPGVLIGIAVAGVVVAGLIVGALMNSGGNANADNAGDKGTTKPSTTSSASATGGASDAADSAAKQQAQALDALLKTSGSSRSSVVSAVESIKNCQNLGTAASDLRSAANQRTGLVTQLGTLAVDKLPGHADLTDALTKAWQASAAADGHYAGWADQAAHNHKVCKGGHARATDEAQAGNRESGSATEQKKRAVRLWNTIAKQYGLTERQYSQL
jgi:hypothetical protein